MLHSMVQSVVQSVVHDPQVAGDNLVLQNWARRDVNSLAVVGDDDHSSPETHWQHNMSQEKISDRDLFTSASKSDIPGDSEVIQLQEVGDGAESWEKCGDLLKLSVAKLD